MAPSHKQSFGRIAEDTVAEWYVRRGYEVLDRNWRTREGEIDLVVACSIDGLHEIVFVEVKARSSARVGSALEAIRTDKAARVRRLGYLWLAAHPSSAGRRRIRFDLAAITGTEFRVVESAF